MINEKNKKNFEIKNHQLNEYIGVGILDFYLSVSSFFFNPFHQFSILFPMDLPVHKKKFLPSKGFDKVKQGRVKFRN